MYQKEFKSYCAYLLEPGAAPQAVGPRHTVTSHIQQHQHNYSDLAPNHKNQHNQSDNYMLDQILIIILSCFANKFLTIKVKEL